MIDKEELKIGTLCYLRKLNVLAVIIDIYKDTYTAINSYGDIIKFDKDEDISLSTKEMRDKDNLHFLDMGLYAGAVERLEESRKIKEQAEKDKEKFLKRIVDNPPQF